MAIQDILKRLLTSVDEFNVENPFLLVSSADVSEGIGKHANRQHQIIFTGYKPNILPIIETSLPEIIYQCWNVHPKYRDLMTVLKHLNCQQSAPLFCDEMTQIKFQKTTP